MQDLRPLLNQNLHFNKLSRRFVCAFKFEKPCPTSSEGDCLITQSCFQMSVCKLYFMPNNSFFLFILKFAKPTEMCKQQSTNIQIPFTMIHQCLTFCHIQFLTYVCVYTYIHTYTYIYAYLYMHTFSPKHFKGSCRHRHISPLNSSACIS